MRGREGGEERGGGRGGEKVAWRLMMAKKDLRMSPLENFPPLCRSNSVYILPLLPLCGEVFIMHGIVTATHTD